MPDDSAFLLDPVPHDQAAKWISDKPVVSREVFDTLLPELQGRAFLVTGVEDANVVAEIRDIVATLPKGETWESSKAAIVEKLGPWFDDEGAANARAELLLRTHGFQAYRTTSRAAMDRQTDIFPYRQYITQGDEKVRLSHRALNELIFPADSPFWHTHPGGWGCRCDEAPLMAEEAEDIRAEDKDLPLEERRFMEGPRLKSAEEGRLVRAVRDDKGKLVRDAIHPWDVSNPGAVASPVSLRINPAELKARYDDATWAEFEAGAKRSRLDDGRTVWQWMNGKRPSQGGKKEKSPGLPDVKTTLTPPPRKSPVSDSITLPTDAREAQVVRNVLAAIDTVHDDGKLDRMRVEFDPIDMVMANGWFDHDAGLLTIASDGLQPHMTIAHEIGHQIDYQLFGNGKAAGTDAMVSAKPEVRAWWDAVRETDTFKALGNPDIVRDKVFREYYQRAPEVWARAYAQFIAEESGDSILQAELDSMRQGKAYFEQWPAEEFKPVAETIRNIITAFKW